jgi:predicted ATP-dependent protease
MSCSVTFEQSYGGIDGDSASSTEVYAILSALSGQALRQDVAVTGSVDQYGHVQAIGGVNEKIEGFFRVCSESKLTSSQGVMIPKSNVKDLHLSEEVVAAANDGVFHVWAVDHVSDGIELLTGRPAGVWRKKDGWSDGSVFAACQDRLDEMVRLMRKAAKSSDKNEATESENVIENDT